MLLKFANQLKDQPVPQNNIINSMIKFLCSCIIFFLSPTVAFPQMSDNTSSMVRIEKGSYVPLYLSEKEKKERKVTSFYIDRYPTTNEQFLKFVSKNPKWQRSNSANLFADEQYLLHWKSAIELGNQVLPHSPVTFVSWFSAKAYCEFNNKRLPTEDEWEYIAKANAVSADGENDNEWKQVILKWYASPVPDILGNIGKSLPNYWGVYDLHGLIWEWVFDFNSSKINSDNRSEKDGENVSFCGSGSLNAYNKSDYAAFMRIGFRSSLKANYTVKTLGFRCAKDDNQ